MKAESKRRWLRLAEALAWTLFFVVASFAIGLRYWILPNVERYRTEIVDAISRAIGLPVEIGAIRADWPGLYPTLEIADLRIRDREGREALVLPGVESAVSWRSLLHRELRLHSFSIDRPQLTVRRTKEGVFHVAGLRVDPGGAEGSFGNWLLSQREIAIRDASIEWRDELRGAPPLLLDSLQLRLRNDDDSHELGFSAHPPAALGARLEVRAALVGRSIDELATWNGRIYAELGSTDLAGWRAWVDYPVAVKAGRGALRVWATLENGEPRRATADVELAGVEARLAADLPALELASIRGRLHSVNQPNALELSGRDLALAFQGGGAPLQPTSFRFTQNASPAKRDPASGEPLRGKLEAKRLELEPLARVAKALPLPAELRRYLTELDPRGVLDDLRLEWHGHFPEASQYALKTRFTGLGLNARSTLPGFAGLSGELDLTQGGGSLRIASRGAQLDFPRIFPEPRIGFDALAGRVEWERGAPGTVALKLHSMEFANAHLAGTASGTYSHDGNGPGTIDLTAQLARADGRFTARYLPHGALIGGEKTREWIAAAVAGGRSSDARLRLKGNLRDFPFADPAKGDFKITARVSEGILDYASGWPRIEGIDGDLLFDRARMVVTGRSASIFGVRLSGVKVELPDLVHHDRRLTVDGQAEGPTADFLRYVAASPVRDMTGGVTEPMSASGRGRLRLRLELPLENIARSRVNGEYQFSQNNLLVSSQLPPIERATGRVNFTESGISIPDTGGQFLGGPVAITGGTRSDGEVVIVAQGDATVAGMRALFEHPWRTRLSGGSPYSATVSVQRGGRSQVSFESQLRGVASDLPAPLGKRSADALPLRVDIFPGEGGARDRISVTLGTVAVAEFLRQREGEAMLVRRVGVLLSPAAGASVRLPERNGVLVSGSVPQLDLDRWLDHISVDAGTGSSGFDLRIGMLDVFGRRLNDVRLRAGADRDGWSANLGAAELAGDLTYRHEAGGRLIARLEHFRLPDAYPGAKPAGGARDLPALDLVVERFTYRGKPLGHVEVLARHDGGNWRLEKLANVAPESALSATGIWRSGTAEQQSQIDFALDVNDVGRFLERVGHPETVRGGSGKVTGSLRWSGDPISVDYPSLGGSVVLQVQNGQILEIEPGIGKLLSLLKFDLSSAFNKGFGFNEIGATADIERGVARIKEFRMRGSAADIFVQGSSNLAQETQDLRVRVVPSLGDGVSSLSGFVWGPIVGVATMIAQRILKNPLGEIFAAEYRVTGSWADPKVERTGNSRTRPATEAQESEPARSAGR
jgi:uncharacterized protein (TIGR02099 family)